MAKNTLKLSTIVGENFEIYMSQMAKNTLKLSTMIGENFEIYTSQMAKNALKNIFEIQICKILGYFRFFLNKSVNIRLF